MKNYRNKQKKFDDEEIQGLRDRLGRLVERDYSGKWTVWGKDLGISAVASAKFGRCEGGFDLKNLMRVVKKYPDEITWLLTGNEPESRAPRFIYFSSPDPEIQAEFERTEKRDTFVPIRILADPVAMGPGREVGNGATDGYAIISDVALPKIARSQKRKDEKVICVWALGDSMEPTIQQKALVAIDLRVQTLEAVQNRKIYAVWLPEGGITLKRVVRREEQLILIADNPNAEEFPRVLLGEDAERAIRGKVCCWWSKQE